MLFGFLGVWWIGGMMFYLYIGFAGFALLIGVFIVMFVVCLFVVYRLGLLVWV